LAQPQSVTVEAGQATITNLALNIAVDQAIVGLRPSFSAHVHLGERGAPVPSDPSHLQEGLSWLGETLSEAWFRRGAH
jgi:hypothetical protein